MRRNKFIISGGGTGGHIFPAISIADELRFRFSQSDILFVGAKDRMEMIKVPAHGYNIKGLWISGLKRKFSFSTILFPLKLVYSLFHSLLIILKFKPEVVIGTGGFASGPIVFIATVLRIPTLIQEQNSYPGITNRILSRSVNKICVSYSDLDKYFPTSKIKLTGNPIRNNISNAEENYDKGIKFYDLDINRKTLLIIGGSQGSREINKHVYNCIDFFNYLNIQVIWQCGKIYYNQYEKLATSENIKLYSFLERIDLAFSVSDYIVSRAGAGSISELCVVGKPVIFIPSPNVAEDHQTKNAKSLVDNDAAILIQEEDLESMFKKMIKELNSSRDLQYKLSKNIKSLAFENATRDIVDEIEKLIKI